MFLKQELTLFSLNNYQNIINEMSVKSSVFRVTENKSDEMRRPFSKKTENEKLIGKTREILGLAI